MPPNSHSAKSVRSRALRARDAGLRRVSFVTRAFVVGSVAAAGAFSTLAAWAQPGHAKTAAANGSFAPGRSTGSTTPPSGTPATNSPTTTIAPSDGGGDGGGYVAPPATVPDPGYQYTGPAVVSGAS